MGLGEHQPWEWHHERGSASASERGKGTRSNGAQTAVLEAGVCLRLQEPNIEISAPAESHLDKLGMLSMYKTGFLGR
jgi:hypothetical protein